MASTPRTPAIARAAEILEFLAKSGEPQSGPSIARATGVPRTSVHGICTALADERMITRCADGRLWLGPRIAELASASGRATSRSLRIGLLIPTRDNAYYTALLGAAEPAAAEAGTELMIREADELPERQRSQWLDLLAAEIDVLLVDSVDSGGLTDLLELSQQRGVPVIAIGSRMAGVDASVTSDNTQAGLLAGRHLGAQLEPGDQVAIIDGLAKNANIDRVAGFTEAIRELTGVEIVVHERGPNDNPASGRAVAARVLKRHRDVAGIFAVCDPIAFGVAEQLRRLGRSVPVVSVDGRAEAVRQASGAGPIVATAVQDPIRIILTAIDIADDLAAGKRPAQGAVMIPVRMITADNAEGYRPWG